MYIRALARGLALAAVAVSVAACEYSPNSIDRTLAYNDAISQSTNDLFLLNALRASQREPTYYTRNQADTTTSTITPTISGTVPWGSTSTVATAVANSSNPIGIPSGFFTTTTVTKTLSQAARSLAASLTGTEQNQLTLTNLDDQQSMQGLLTPVALQQISNYLNEGFSPQELYFLYMQSLSIPEPMLTNLPDAVAENCAVKFYQLQNDPSNPDRKDLLKSEYSYCRYFFNLNFPGISRKETASDSKDHPVPDVYVVDSKNPVKFVKFTETELIPGRMSAACFDGGIVHGDSPEDTVIAYGKKVEESGKTDAFKAWALGILRQDAKNISTQVDADEKLSVPQNAKELTSITKQLRSDWSTLKKVQSDWDALKKASDIEQFVETTSPFIWDAEQSPPAPKNAEEAARILATQLKLDSDDLNEVQYLIGQAVGTTPPVKLNVFVNDPAVLDVTQQGIVDTRHFVCFKQVLTALLALDFAPVPGSTKALYRVPMDYAKDNSRYLADLSQQSLSVGQVAPSTDIKDKDDLTKQAPQIGACKKPDDLAMGVAADGYVKALFSLGYDAEAATPNPLYSLVANPVHSGNGNSALHSVSFQPSNSRYAIQLSSDVAKITPKSDCANAVAALKFADADGNSPDSASDANSLIVNYTPRSLEAMVYYLGQIIRHKFSEAGVDADSRKPDPDDVTFYNTADPNGPPYDEELFDVEKGTLTSEGIAFASASGNSYYVPKLCPGIWKYQHQGGCTSEYPDHASAQILTVLNQIWGLYKTQATAPIVAPVTVINPG